MADYEFPQYSSLDQTQDYTNAEDSKLSIFDQDSPDIANMEREAFNYIQYSGAPTHIYLRTNDLLQVDDVWEEDSDPIYDCPVTIKGQFVPEKMSLALTKYGVDTKSQFEVHYSRAQLLSHFGNRLIRTGDVVGLPHNTLVQTQNTEFVNGQLGLANKFRVISATDTGNYNYRWLYWTCIVELLTGNFTVRPDNA
jgi:hypothetical protein